MWRIFLWLEEVIGKECTGAIITVLLLTGLAFWLWEQNQKKESTKEPPLLLPLSKYEGTRVSVMYPPGWNKIEEGPRSLLIANPLVDCCFIVIGWEEGDFHIGQMAEDRYRSQREDLFHHILTTFGDEPRFKILREYRLGDAPVFEFQYWNKVFEWMENNQFMRYIDLETRQRVIGCWNLRDWSGPTVWHREMDHRRTLFDTVMQSITFK